MGTRIYTPSSAPAILVDGWKPQRITGSLTGKIAKAEPVVAVDNGMCAELRQFLMGPAETAFPADLSKKRKSRKLCDTRWHQLAPLHKDDDGQLYTSFPDVPLDSGQTYQLAFTDTHVYARRKPVSRLRKRRSVPSNI